MITKADIIQMVKRIHRESHGLPPRRLMYPAREWAIGVVLTLVVIAVICVLSGIAYLYLSDIAERVEPVTPTTVRYDENAVARALELYELRAQRSANLGATAPALPPLRTTPPDTATSSATSSSVLPVDDTATAPVATATPQIGTSTPTAAFDAEETDVVPVESGETLQVF